MKHPRSWLAPRSLAVGGLLLLTSACASNDVSRYVGKDPYIAFPASQVVDQSLMQLDPAHPDADWGLSLIWEGGYYLLTADQNIDRGGLRQSWRVRAVQRVPLLKYGQMLALGDCADATGPVTRVVAVVNYDHRKPWFDDVVFAWAFDPGEGAFVAYPVDGLRCENRLYGTDLSPPPSSFRAQVPSR